MPKLTTLVKILRDGSKEHSNLRQSLLQSADGDLLLALRNHYDRLEMYWMKQKQDRAFIGESVAKLAITAERDSILGILDTLAREFITFWLPELELCVEDFGDDDQEIRKKIVLGIERNVINVAKRLDCAADKSAAVLQKALINLVVSYTGRTPESDNKATTTATTEHISEARILNSAIAWDVADRHMTENAAPAPALKSPVKRGYCEAFSQDDPDPSDNGAVWDTQRTTKRQKFEIKISKIIDVSDNDDSNQHSTSYVQRRILKPTSRINGNKKSAAKEGVASTKSTVDERLEAEVPGALKTTDENCTLM